MGLMGGNKGTQMPFHRLGEIFVTIYRVEVDRHLLFTFADILFVIWIALD